VLAGGEAGPALDVSPPAVALAVPGTDAVGPEGVAPVLVLAPSLVTGAGLVASPLAVTASVFPPSLPQPEASMRSRADEANKRVVCDRICRGRG
jgi:hypothetical protein